jgi:hypothetical protein
VNYSSRTRAHHPKLGQVLDELLTGVRSSPFSSIFGENTEKKTPRQFESILAHRFAKLNDRQCIRVGLRVIGCEEAELRLLRVGVRPAAAGRQAEARPGPGPR